MLEETNIHMYMQMMQLSFERAYDKKTGLVQELEKTMENNEQEYDTSVDMHMYNIDRMMGELFSSSSRSTVICNRSRIENTS
jgi:hypothetical protein